MIMDFHFIRPLLLLLLALPVLVLWLAYRSGDVRAQWKSMIAPHLLDNLVIGASSGTKVRPSWLLTGILVMGIVGAAGPTWQREPPPFVEDTAPLVIAVDLSQTMDAIDVTPSRIERAKLKIKDVIDARPGARTALVAYAGSAHLVLPATEDVALLENYFEALATRIMPKPGKDTAAAVRLADGLLDKEGSAGTILLLTDGIEAAAAKTMRSSSNGIVVLGIGTSTGGPVRAPDGVFVSDANGARLFSKLDMTALKEIAKEGGADVVDGDRRRHGRPLDNPTSSIRLRAEAGIGGRPLARPGLVAGIASGRCDGVFVSKGLGGSNQRAAAGGPYDVAGQCARRWSS